MTSAEINYTRAAFLHQWNLVFLTAAAALAIGISMVPGAPPWLFEVILFLATGGELLYLGVMPRNARFKRHIRSQQAAEARKPPSQKELFRQLTRHSQRRYARLRKLRTEIATNYRDLSYAAQGMLDNHLKKLDDLLSSYLEMLHQRERYRRYMDASRDADIDRTIATLKDEIADASERVQAVKKRRLHILQRRRDRLTRGHENLEIIGAQLGTIEDVFKYIHEQSWTLQDPEAISFQLDQLMEEVEETQQSVRQIEDVFSGGAGLEDVDDLMDLDEPLEDAASSSASTSASRSRSA
ncbi:hypothetical protein [Salisaeta longa]|uniref:hypothetical protein n=1 Tax=Salisaeta longa TaxID=503170 RepID=UPI0003B49820